MIIPILLSASFIWQTNVYKMVRAQPKFNGQIVKVCVDKDCIVVDQTKTTLSAKSGVQKVSELNPLEKEIQVVLDNAGVASPDNTLNWVREGTDHSIIVVITAPTR